MNEKPQKYDASDYSNTLFLPRTEFPMHAGLPQHFLFDFNGDLYGATLDVAFIGFIREEAKFDSVDALVRQMDDDSARARAALAAAPGAFPTLGVVD